MLARDKHSRLFLVFKIIAAKASVTFMCSIIKKALSFTQNFR
jgi:hypothetical protein